MERGHANFWKQFLEKKNVSIPNVNTVKLRKYIALILNKLTNPVLVISFLELGESGGVKEYYDFLTKAPLSEEEKEKLKKIIPKPKKNNS